MTLRATRQYVDVLSPGAGKARVTRQYVDVLSPGAGKAQVTRQYVDVLLDATCESVSQAMGLTDSVSLNGLFGLAAGNVAMLADTVEARGPIYFQVRHVLRCEDAVVGHLSTIHVSVEDTIEFVDQINRHIPVVASDILVMIDSGTRRKTGIASSVLTLAETISAGKGKDVDQDLALVQQVEVAAILCCSVTHDFGLVQSGAYQKGRSCVTRQYTPFVGFSEDTTTTPPATTAPTLGDATLTLTYPFVSPTLTVVLRNPEFGNKDSLNFNRINRQTRGGTLVVFADSTWPQTQTLHVEVRWLKASQVADLLTFFSTSLGKEVGLLDHENRQWRGIVTDPDAAIANPEHGDYTVTFDFEGELDEEGD